ncbi:hypothetical protein EV361DRAFT_874223, partial [Lentinula raphanica]
TPPKSWRDFISFNSLREILAPSEIFKDAQRCLETLKHFYYSEVAQDLGGVPGVSRDRDMERVYKHDDKHILHHESEAKAVGTAHAGSAAKKALGKTTEKDLGSTHTKVAGRAVGSIHIGNTEKDLGKASGKDLESTHTKVTGKAVGSIHTGPAGKNLGKTTEEKPGSTHTREAGQVIGTHIESTKRGLGNTLGNNLGSTHTRAAGTAVSSVHTETAEKSLSKAVGEAFGRATGEALGKAVGEALGKAAEIALGSIHTRSAEHTIGSVHTGDNSSGKPPDSYFMRNEHPEYGDTDSFGCEATGASTQGPMDPNASDASTQEPEDTGVSTQEPEDTGAFTQEPEDTGASTQEPEEIEPTRPGTRQNPYPRPRVSGTRPWRVPGFLQSGCGQVVVGLQSGLLNRTLQELAEPCLWRGWASPGSCRSFRAHVIDQI